MNLRELTEEQEAILALVESGDFTLDDVSDHLDMLKEDRNKKIESYLYVINNIESDLKVVQAEMERLAVIAESKAKALKNIKLWLLMSMRDGEKIEFELFKVGRVKGRDVANVTDENALPIGCFSHNPESWSVDKREILKRLKGGEEVEGAEIIQGSASLRIK